MIKKISQKLFSKQFLKYLVVGFTGTAADFALLYVFVQYFHIFYLLAAFFSIAIVLWYSFTLNKYWTFENKEKKYFPQFLKYVIAHSIALGINLLILAILVQFFHLWYLFAKVFATAAAAIANFFMVKSFIFEGKKADSTIAFEK